MTFLPGSVPRDFALLHTFRVCSSHREQVVGLSLTSQATAVAAENTPSGSVSLAVDHAVRFATCVSCVSRVRHTLSCVGLPISCAFFGGAAPSRVCGLFLEGNVAAANQPLVERKLRERLMSSSGLKITRRASSQPNPTQAVVKRGVPRQKPNPHRPIAATGGPTWCRSRPLRGCDPRYLARVSRDTNSTISSAYFHPK